MGKRMITKGAAHQRGKMKKGSWSKGELEALKKGFGDRLTAEIAEKLGRPLDAVKKKASRMGLYKSKSYLKSLGRG